MARFFVVVDELSDWSPYYPSQNVITFQDYLSQIATLKSERVRVINLCRNYKYLGSAWYCALLAEARGHHVFPSVRTLSDFRSRSLSSIQLDGIDPSLRKIPHTSGEKNLAVRIWFGECADRRFASLAKILFERFPCPLMQVSLECDQDWKVDKIRPISLRDLKSNEEQEAFANAFERFSSKLWRKPKSGKRFRYDLAILANDKEEMPPSDRVALKKFIKAAEEQGISAELIGAKDYMRIPEYDGLFIRETTAVGHHTYQFAKKAEAEGMVVIDDPTSILRCTNKVYLAELLNKQNIPTPQTRILHKSDAPELAEKLADMGFPLVLKVPDGSFSRGVVRVADRKELETEGGKLLKSSALLLVQEYMYTEYDWRIGVLNNKALYACRYYMVKNHWQIYKHGADSSVKSGGFDAMPTFEAPKAVVDAALSACKLIGDGFYGVDLKQSGNRVAVIEVNDNPSIDSGVEDQYLGNQLYSSFMEDFLRRLEYRRRK
ncbi:MAG: glutathione synthase/RimK-type ligase-like ATP-grasp enzyme [Bermanella sp.]|jgi:glutathione synthase/RimK-type ligase-like ATP-grasp enzyme